MVMPTTELEEGWKQLWGDVGGSGGKLQFRQSDLLKAALSSATLSQALWISSDTTSVAEKTPRPQPSYAASAVPQRSVISNLPLVGNSMVARAMDHDPCLT